MFHSASFSAREMFRNYIGCLLNVAEELGFFLAAHPRRMCFWCQVRSSPSPSWSTCCTTCCLQESRMLKVPDRNNFRFCTGENIGSGGMKKNAWEEAVKWGVCLLGGVPGCRECRGVFWHGAGVSYTANRKSCSQLLQACWNSQSLYVPTYSKM